MSKRSAELAIPLRTPVVEHDVLLGALPHPILVVSDNNQILYGNAAAEGFLSTSNAMLTRQRLDDVVAFGCPLLTLVDQVREHGSTVNEYGIEMASPKFATPKLVDVYAGPMMDSPSQIVVMLQQRTMAQMIERQLTHRAAARSVSGMAAVLAHEIKNPLSGIKGAAQLLEQNLSDEDRVLSRLICSETERIRNLVNRMEVFGDERPLTKEAVNIHDVLNHVRRLSESGFARGVRIIEDYDPSLPPIPGNRDKLVQAFLNLIKNAAEAIVDTDDRQGRIIMQTSFRPGVRLSVPGSDQRINLPLMIQIEDNGSGVPDHLKPHLFDPFVTTKHNGTGLGLALVAKIIGDHGGIIECESEAKRTVFRVLLPMQDRIRKDGVYTKPVAVKDTKG
ncbi:two-component system sensor histidine kinase NtrB [Hyphomicrobium sp.]|uniref:two-component system sensor histidine kinase NtrB n=1 Tax=Hyphomicrobium sp. TaxID=82 RepID=UPI003F712BE6